MKFDQFVEVHSTVQKRVPKAAYALTGCIAVIGSNSLVLGAIAPEVARAFVTPVTTVMLAAAAFGLGTATSALFLACRIDCFGADHMLKRSMGLLVGALILTALSPAVSALIAAQLVAGIASGVALPAIYAGAASVATPGYESRTIGVVLTGWTLSMVAGVSLSAFLANFIHWRLVYAVVALLALLACTALRHVRTHNTSGMASAPAPLSALNLVGIKPLLVVCGAFTAAFYGFYAYLGDYLHHGLGQPIMVNGIAALIYGLGFGSATLFNGVADRIGARKLMPLVLLSIASAYLVLAVVGDNLSAVLVIMFLLGLANHFSVNLLIMRLTEICPTKRGTIMGLNSAVTYLAVFIGVGSFGLLYSLSGFAMTCYAALLLTLVAAITCAWHS